MSQADVQVNKKKPISSNIKDTSIGIIATKNIPYYFVPACRLLVQLYNDIHDFFQKSCVILL